MKLRERKEIKISRLPKDDFRPADETASGKQIYQTKLENPKVGQHSEFGNHSSMSAYWNVHIEEQFTAKGSFPPVAAIGSDLDALGTERT